MSVKRWSLTKCGWAPPEPEPDGDYVLFSDYEALREAALAVVNSMDYDSDAPLIRELQEAAK
jgi:hypothetical protein